MAKKKLKAEHAFELSKAFHELASQLGDYRFAHWDEMSPKQRTNMEGLQWSIFNASSDLNARSVVMKTSLLESDLESLTKTVMEMKAAAKKIKSIKHAIRIAAKTVAFAGGIASGNVPVTISASKELLNEINA